MVAPATYYGYDENQNCIVTGSAEDATQYINPEEVQDAIENLQQVVEEQMNKIVTKLTNISDDAGQAVIIQGAKMTGTLEDAAAQIKQLPAQMFGDIDSLKAAADNARDVIQQSNNDAMYNTVASCSGVVVVK